MDLGHKVSRIAAALRDDAELIELWLHGRSRATQIAYRRDVARFLAYIEKSLAEVTLADLLDYASTINHLSDATRARMLSAVKSLLAFGHDVGHLPVNVGRPLKSPTVTRPPRAWVLSEAEVRRMIDTEPSPRNRLLIHLLYSTGLRVSEVCSLTWQDVRPRGSGGEVTVGAGSASVRVLALSPVVWREMANLRREAREAADGAPVFRSQKGGHLHASSVWRVVRAASVRAGVDLPVSPRWLRHATAAHSLDRGMSIHAVQAMLGHRSPLSLIKYLGGGPPEAGVFCLGML